MEFLRSCMSEVMQEQGDCRHRGNRSRAGGLDELGILRSDGDRLLFAGHRHGELSSAQMGDRMPLPGLKGGEATLDGARMLQGAEIPDAVEHVDEIFVAGLVEGQDGSFSGGHGDYLGLECLGIILALANATLP